MRRSQIFRKCRPFRYPPTPSESWRPPPPQIPGSRPNVIVAGQPALYGLARMFELSRDSMGGRLQIVRSMDEAYGLLEVAPQDFSQRLFPEDEAA